jgi:hypothetical protein
MTLQQLADERMLSGKASHPDQDWDDMCNAELMGEAREELADCYNYYSKQTLPRKVLAYILLNILWRISLK